MTDTGPAPVDRTDFPVGRATAWLAIFLVLCLVVGIGAGVLWERVVTLPGYTVAENGTAHISERALTEVFNGDSWFSALGFLISIGLGIVAWKWFGRLGWPVVVVAIAGAVVGALVCWYVGSVLGPGDFEPRLAAADPGEFVPITLRVRSPAALLVWAFGAVLPVLLHASLGRDEEEDLAPPAPRRRRRR